MTNHIDLSALTLSRGAHESPQDGVCIMEAVAWWAGEPHSDRPACVSVVIGAFLRKWNDDLDDDTRQKLKRFIPLLPGTAADAKTEERRIWRVIYWVVHTYLPAWLRLAGMRDQAEAVEQLPTYVDAETAEASQKTLTAVEAATRDETWEATRDATRDAAWAVARDATRVTAWEAARDSAWAVARDATRYATWDATWNAAWDMTWYATKNATREAARGSTWAAARKAARDAVKPTVISLQESALQLVDELIAMKAVSVS